MFNTALSVTGLIVVSCKADYHYKFTMIFTTIITSGSKERF